MADNEKYFIRLHGKEIEVSEDVYYAYYRMERQERWQEEKKQEHDVVSYDAMDNGETVGAEAIGRNRRFLCIYPLAFSGGCLTSSNTDRPVVFCFLCRRTVLKFTLVNQSVI